MSNAIPFKGTRLKFLVEPTAQGFDKAEDNWEVEVSRGSQKVQVWKKEDLLDDGEGNYYITVDTEFFGSGQYMLTVTTYTPDEDFDDGFRIDVEQIPLINVQNLKK